MLGNSFYFKVAEIMEETKQHQRSWKSLIFKDATKDKKLIYGLVCELLKYSSVLEEILTKSQILRYEKKLPKKIVSILIYELLFLNNLRCNSEWRNTILKYKSRLNAELARIKIKRSVSSNAELADGLRFNQFPKYLRINTLKTSLNECIEHFKSSFFFCKSPEEFEKKAENAFYVDELIDNLLAFSSNTAFFNDEFYLGGKVFIQDKPSCFPAFILNPPVGSFVIDCCAAPGNKTTHLAMLMQGRGKLMAFEKSEERFATLLKMTSLAAFDTSNSNSAGSCNSTVNSGSLKKSSIKGNANPSKCYEQNGFLHCINADFLATNPASPDISEAEYILVDPSCSGSGMVSRLDHLIDGAVDPERLKTLSAFQSTILLHAMSFPNVKRVVYSTCSVNDEENERVVENALAQMKGKFRLVPCLSEWKRRGLRLQECVRVLPEEDNMNGFFVALFERVIS